MGSSDHLPDQFRSQAKRHASQKAVPTLSTTTSELITTDLRAKSAKHTQAGGLSVLNGRGGSSSSDSSEHHDTLNVDNGGGQLDEGGVLARQTEKPPQMGIDDAPSSASHPPAAPPIKSEAASAGNSTIDIAGENKKIKQPMSIARMKAGCKRFGGHFKRAICHSWINVLLVAVPVGIAAKAANLNPSIVFAINAVAIVPLAGLLSHATESVASRLGDTLGALLNVSFGNAVELIIFIIALVKDEIRIVQASLLGSILANLLLILGMAFLLGGLRYREQVYNSTVTQMSACLLSLSVMSLLLPTAFHAAFNDANLKDADRKVLKVSRGTSVVLLLVYGLYLLFQLKSHAYMYESTPQDIIDEESHPGVLHELMNSSSSSDDSSSSDSSSSDTSGSGSVATTTKRMKRMFKHKRRRKSSVSTSSTQTAERGFHSVASPTIEDPNDHPAAGNGQSASRTGSAAQNTTHDDADADREDNGISRVYDWATRKQHSHEGSKSPERKKRSKRDIKREKKGRREAEKAARQEALGEISAQPHEGHGQSRVGFAEEVQVAPSPATPGRLPFNMRQLSRGQSRPILPSILSNNVFVQPAPNVTPPSARPVGPARSRTDGGQLRRTNSLPDRLNRQTTPAGTNDPIPPFQRKARSIRQIKSGLSTTPSDDGEEEQMSRTAAVVLLLCSTALVAVCAEFLVDAIPEMLKDSDNISEAFIGLIVLPIVGNAAEHVTAVTVAAKNKMDLAIGVAVGSSIQIALFVTPVVVLLGWILDTNMSLYFNIFETVSLFVTAFVVNFLVLDGRSNYLEGSLLIAAYVIIAVGAFFYPNSAEQSSFGGGGGGGT